MNPTYGDAHSNVLLHHREEYHNITWAADRSILTTSHSAILSKGVSTDSNLAAASCDSSVGARLGLGEDLTIRLRDGYGVYVYFESGLDTSVEREHAIMDRWLARLGVRNTRYKVVDGELLINGPLDGGGRRCGHLFSGQGGRLVCNTEMLFQFTRMINMTRSVRRDGQDNTMYTIRVSGHLSGNLFFDRTERSEDQAALKLQGTASRRIKTLHFIGIGWKFGGCGTGLTDYRVVDWRSSLDVCNECGGGEIVDIGLRVWRCGDWLFMGNVSKGMCWKDGSAHQNTDSYETSWERLVVD
ncbi:hypothetical protein Tco_0623412 [Tanacetum coccineum]